MSKPDTVPQAEKDTLKMDRADVYAAERIHALCGNLFTDWQEEIAKAFRSGQQFSLSGQVHPFHIPAELDTPSFRAAWDEYVTHRKQKRSSLTPVAAKKQLAKMVPWGPDRAVAAIHHSLAQGYTGIFEERSNDARGRTENGRQPYRQDNTAGQRYSGDVAVCRDREESDEPFCSF